MATHANVKPHTKVHVSVAHHPKTSDVWADLRQRGMLVEIWRLAVERYAAKRGNKLALRPLDRQSIVPDRDAAGADAELVDLFRTLRYALRKYPNRWEVEIRNLAKKHGIRGGSEGVTQKGALLKKEERREKKEERREKIPPPPKTTHEDPGGTPGYETGEWIEPMLKLSSRATAPERSCWVEAKWVEIVAAGEIEQESQGGSLGSHVKKIASARWNAYLRERDPTSRQFAREATARATVASRKSFESQMDALEGTPEKRKGNPVPGDQSAEIISFSPRHGVSGAADDESRRDEDPLAMMRAGVNPYAN